jgi:hypothetical protein
VNHIATIGLADTLPTLIDRATAALESARSSGEVLEARDMARMAYDAAKSAARIMRAKEAHDSLIADVHRSQAHALAIRARAEMRLAEEYDAAQDRGEVGKRGDFGGVTSRGEDTPTAADLGLSHKDIHEFRSIRDAEHAEPGVVQKTIDKIVERGEEPTRAALKRELSAKPKPVMPREPLWVWGRVKDFDRDGILKITPAKIAAQMTPQMRGDMREQLPAVIAYLTELKERV